MSHSRVEEPLTQSHWSPRQITLKEGILFDVLTMPAPDSDAVLVLPQAPQLVYGREVNPLFSLSLILSRLPEPTEENIQPLIERGLLTLTVQSGVPQGVLEALTNCHTGVFQRLFARQVDYVVTQTLGEDKPPQELARAAGSGTEGRAGISVHLNREQTLDVLGAMDRTPSSLSLTATVHYRSTRAPRTVHLSGAWSQIHDYLSLYKNDLDRLTVTAIQKALPTSVDKGLLVVQDAAGNPMEIATEQLYRLFMRQASIVLKRGVATENGETWYHLRGRPHDSFHLNYSETIHEADMQTCELTVSLEQLIGQILEDRNWDNYVHLIARQADAMVTPVPRRVRAATSQRDHRRGGNSLKVAAMENAVTSIALATRPNTLNLSPQKLAQLQRPDLTVNQAMLDDMRIELPQKDRPRGLPIIHNPKAAYWRDRLNAQKLWYAPTFDIVPPSPNEDPASSPFVFSFERVGVTNTGQPALRGEVQFTLQAKMSNATAAALKKVKGSPQSVPLNQLAVSLLIPFVNTDNGQVKRHRFTAAEVTERGDHIIVKVALLNEWVRLAYGALAIEDFQTLTAQVKVDYAFSGYVPVKQQDLELAYGGKAYYTPVIYSSIEAERLKNSTYFDAAALTYSRPQTQLRFQRETAGSTRQERRNLTASLAQFHKPTINAAIAKTPVVHPQLTIEPSIATLLQKVEYATRTQLHQESQSILLPCRTFGRFYQALEGDTATPIGCQDALTLGQTRYQQYEEITELRTARFQAYRSLQQPGQFLVVPAQFCVTRRSASEADAYRPNIFLHALLDAEDPDNNRVELRTSLQPDLAIFERLELLEKLKSYDINPVLQYPTDIDTEAVKFTWAIDPKITASSEADAFDAAGPFIGTYFQMDLPSWQLIRSVLNSSGLEGSVVFDLADGTRLSADLLLKLDHIRGPWEDGPLAISRGSGQLTLTNKIEHAIEVSDLVRFAGATQAHSLPVEATIAPGQTQTVKSNHDLVPIYRYPPSDPVEIEEIRSFVENIYSNFIFISLVNFTNHDLRRLEVEAQVQGIGDRYTAQLTPEMSVADISVVLPLTTYLEQRVLEFRVTKIFDDGTSDRTRWLQWDLDAAGLVSITSELIGL